MEKLVLRQSKGEALTHQEMDRNLSSLEGGGITYYFKDFDTINAFVFENIIFPNEIALCFEGLFVENGSGSGNFVYSSGNVSLDESGFVSVFENFSLGENLFDTVDYPENISYVTNDNRLFINLSTLESSFSGSVKIHVARS